MHMEVLARVLGSKLWRQKLLVLQNIEARTHKGENTGVLLGVLVAGLGDRIAGVRVALGDCVAKMVVKGGVSVKGVLGVLGAGRGSANWF